MSVKASVSGPWKWPPALACSPALGPPPDSPLASTVRTCRRKHLPRKNRRTPGKRTGPGQRLPRYRGRPPIPMPRARGTSLLGTLLRTTREQSTDLGLPVAPVPPQRSDGCKLPCLCPPRDGLWVDAEHRRDLRRRQQRLGFGRACGHVCSLSSWTGVAILCGCFS